MNFSKAQIFCELRSESFYIQGQHHLLVAFKSNSSEQQSDKEVAIGSYDFNKSDYKPCIGFLNFKN